jgi:signal transduction histidine kinase
MTGYFLLDWAILAVSLFNTILCLWLGLTVLLNADRRNWGVWLMGGGLLVGAAFFVSHTAILGQELAVNADGLNFWWHVGWIPVIVAPFAWYVVILWYAGFWRRPRPTLYRRHAAWLVIACFVLFGLIGLILVANPLPTYDQIIKLDLSSTLMLGGIPALFLGFPAFMVYCVVLSIDALLRPAPAERPMSEQARNRSRRWLLGTAAVLLSVSLLVTYFITRIVAAAVEGTLSSISIPSIGLFDLTLSGLIAVAEILLGQAVVSYEVFTGKTLPRRGFFRHWRNILIIASGYALVVGWSLAVHLRPIYSLLLTTGLMVVFYALYSWRSFVEREAFMARLRPFVSNQRLITTFFSDGDDAASRAFDLFAAVCRDVLGAEAAQITPLGALAPLAGGPLVYPRGAAAQTVDLPDNPRENVVALDSSPGGFQWVIPLWAERGLIGLLAVAKKRDGGLYTQEEIEIARVSGERIVEMLAGEQITRRLMQLQRTRLAETRVMDLGTRRALHDDILPMLHTSVLQLSALSRDVPAVREAIGGLSAVHRQIADLIHTAQNPPSRLNGKSGLLEALQDVVKTEFSGAFDLVTWQITPFPDVDPLVCEVVLGAAREVIRNAAVHGRGDDPKRPLRLIIAAWYDDALRLKMTDDGVGMEQGASGDNGGSNGGLALHSTLLAVVGAYMAVEPASGGGTAITIVLPNHERRV